jgi:cephalosporin-C deacetylase-like acetyl esterase
MPAAMPAAEEGAMAKYDLREDFAVLHTPHGRMLEDYFARLGLELLARHPYPATREEWEARRGELQARLRASLGLTAEEPRTPLNATVLGTLQRDGYIVEKIRFESRPGWYVAALLYRPARQEAPAPGILCPHGHWYAGKRSWHVQALGITLARRGYVALALDMVGYNDRAFMGHRDTYYLMATGCPLSGLLAWDNIRALDYLCARPEVDARRIGCTGASGGGNQTMYLSAIDERIQVGVPVCSVEVYADYFSKGCCTCEVVPELFTYADEPHLLGLVAPRALLFINGIKDSGFPILSARLAFERARRIYELYDPAKLALAEVYAEHGYERAMREHAYRWFDRWLKEPLGEDKGPVDEGAVWVEPEEADTLCLWAAGEQPTGALTCATYYTRVTEAPRPPGATGDALRSAIVERVFGGFPPRTPLQPQHVETIERTECRIDKLVIHSEPDILLPALLLQPRRATGPTPAIVLLSPSGKARAVQRRDVLECLRAGWSVLAIDYRGVGETAAGENGERFALIRSLKIGHYLFGLRVWDTLRAVEYLREREDVQPDRVVVWGEREGALLALYAGALDTRLAAVMADYPLASYRGGQDGAHAAWLYPWRVLDVCDVPDVAALVAPRPLVLANATGPDAKPLPHERALELFTATRQAYATAGAPEALGIFRGSHDETVTRMLALLDQLAPSRAGVSQ